MSTSKNEIREWFLKGKHDGATHMIIVCDKWDFTDFPVYVMPDQDVHEVEHKFRIDANTHKVMEVYHMGMNMEEQLAKGQVFNYEIPGQEKPKCPLDMTPLFNVGPLKMYNDEKDNYICAKCKRVWIDVDKEEWSTRVARVKIEGLWGPGIEGQNYNDIIKVVE